MSKISINDIKAQLPSGWALLTEEYKNLDQELLFECDHQHRIYSSWKKMRNNCECPFCKENYKKTEDKIIPKKKGSFRAIGLDQATYITGYSIFEDGKLIKYSTFQTTLDGEIERDNQVKMWLISLINSWKPDYIGIEGIQYQQMIGVTTFETLARLQGILMETCYEQGIPYEICPTNTWRAHCGVKGKTRSDKKKSMQLIVREQYELKVSEDEADAIGIGKYIYDTKHQIGKIENWE